MLIRFIVSNFLSFKDETEFNMLTGNFQRHPHHVYHREHVDVLKAAAIYGANGAGKSNLIKAIAFLKDLVTNKEKNNLSSLQRFKLEPEYATKPAHFEIEFETNGKTFSYGIECHQDRICEEWLVQVGFGKEKDTLIFERKTDETYKHHLRLAQKYLQTEKQKYFVEFFEEQLLKAELPFISLVQKEMFEEVDICLGWIGEKIMIIYPDKVLEQVWFVIIAHDGIREYINKTFSTLDTGVISLVTASEDYKPNSDSDLNRINKLLSEMMEIESIKYIPDIIENRYFQNIALEGEHLTLKSLQTLHKNSKDKEIVFDINCESDGTRRIIEFLYIFMYFSAEDRTIFIDEIDRSIHPSLLKEFLKKIMEAVHTKGQIIFTTHESNLLDLEIFRQDEIWFAEKNKEGASTFYSLSDFKPRADLDIRKGYLNGRFGAIPFLANLENLDLNTANATPEPSL